jgi:predicted ATP-grasp superfamily ATP-dependent carboligase
MHHLVDLWETPKAEETYMIVGWHQWADAGAISSGLPQYLIKHTNAKKIGEIRSGDFYLFQIPGTHHFLRPEITLEDGYPKALTARKNEVFYTGNDEKGLVIFLGTEPHLNTDQYSQAFFDIAEALNVKRIVGVGGVYAAMPYDKDREISCAYSLRHLKDELTRYAVRFSNYEGGTTIGSLLLDKARQRDIEFMVFYALVPAYNFSELSTSLQGMRIENDYKAWYDLMRRFNHMFNLGIDLSDLQEQSDELTESMNLKADQLDREAPELNIKEYLEKVSKEFTEKSFMPLDDVWERELGDLFEDMDE